MLNGVGLASALFLLASAVAWWLLRRQRKEVAVAVLALANSVCVLIGLQAHNGYGLQKSSAELVRAVPEAFDPAVPVYAVRSYDQTLPFYLRRPVTQVDYRDEYSFGEQHEPQRWIASLPEFVARWQAEPRGVAYLEGDTLTELTALGLQARVVLRDDRRVLLAKP
jgi:hypothetical protein